MFNSIRISILAAGICALSLALLFASGNIPPITTIFSHLPQSLNQLANDINDKNNTNPTDLSDTISLEEKNTKTTEKQKKSEEVLGTPPEKIKTIQEERALVKESPLPPPPVPMRLPSQTLYAIASDRVVNLFCELSDNEVAIATGVIIHPDGYILTNAHVADTEQSHSCLIRRGSPARNFAIAERVFLPPGFSATDHTRDNLARDVAIWKITNVIEEIGAKTFPSFSIRPPNLPTDGTTLATFSYPAELLGSQAVVSALHLSFSETKIVAHDAYFIESTQGLGSQKGSSGGILLDPYTGEFTGLIFAINDNKTESISERTLFSLTPFAINETIRTTTGKDLDVYLAELP